MPLAPREQCLRSLRCGERRPEILALPPLRPRQHPAMGMGPAPLCSLLPAGARAARWPACGAILTLFPLPFQAADKGSRKRYEPSDKDRQSPPPAKRANLSPDRGERPASLGLRGAPRGRGPGPVRSSGRARMGPSVGIKVLEVKTWEKVSTFINVRVTVTKYYIFKQITFLMENNYISMNKTQVSLFFLSENAFCVQPADGGCSPPLCDGTGHAHSGGRRRAGGGSALQSDPSCHGPSARPALVTGAEPSFLPKQGQGLSGAGGAPLACATERGDVRTRQGREPAAARACVLPGRRPAAHVDLPAHPTARRQTPLASWFYFFPTLSYLLVPSSRV